MSTEFHNPRRSTTMNTNEETAALQSMRAARSINEG